MNKSMLVGAVGLALAGVAVASDGVGYARQLRTDVNAFTQVRDSVLGQPGSTHRAEVLAQLRADIAAGLVDPRTVVFVISEDLIPGVGKNAVNLSGNGSETEGGGLGSNALFFDDFSTYQLTNYSNPPTSFVGINGQTNPAGQTVAADPWMGAADDSVMTSNTMIPPGQPGGVAPLSQPAGGAPYLALARATGEDTITTAFALAMNQLHMLGVPGSDPNTGHLRLSTDWYLYEGTFNGAPGPITSQWWSPVSFVEGFVWDRVFFGGTNLGGVLGAFENGNGYLDRFVSLGTLAGNFTIGQFYGHPVDANFPFPTDEWFSIMSALVQSPGGGIGYGLFVKTEDTVANNFLDPRMASGDIIPSDKEAAGWLNTYPGIDDDLGTAEIEGLGLAVTQFGELAGTGGAFNLAGLLAAISASGTQFGEGNDPVNEPTYFPGDALADNYIFKGSEFQRPCPIADFIIPYKEDFESYNGGEPIRIQSDRFFDALSSNAVISTLQNTTTGGSQSIAQQNTNNDNLMRQEFNTALPLFPARVQASAGDDGIPFTNDANEESMVVQANIRLNPTTRTGRALRVFDANENGNFVGSVLLGGTDPTGAFAAADGTVWVRQPNVGPDGVWGTPPGFDMNEDPENNLVQVNWIPEGDWAVPPAGTPDANGSIYNTQFINVRAGATGNASGQTVAPGSFATIRIEVQPNPNQDPDNQFDESIMKVFYNGTELFPNGDSGQAWLGGGLTASTAQFWSSNNTNGQFDTIHVDDLCYEGPLFVRVPGPADTVPFLDPFSDYPLELSIQSQGDTGYLSLASVPDAPANDAARKLTVLDSNSNPISDGTMVCRYMVTTAKIGGGLFNPGDIVALNHDALPAPFDTFLDTNTDCPGAEASDTPYVIRPGENMPRVEEGDWMLLNQDPVAFDSGTMGSDVTSLSYSFTTLARYVAAGVDSVALVKPDPVEGGGVDQVVQIESTFGVDGSQTNNPMFGAFNGFLPLAESSAGVFPNPATDVEVQFELYIESLDENGNADSNLAPRSRFEVAFAGAGGNAGRITNIMFGGPNVNNHTNLQAENPPVPIIAPDEISYRVPSALTDPDTQYESTGVSLINGGMGLGNMLNTWFRGIFTLSNDGSWTFAIDDDRDGPNAPVTIATGTAIDFGLVGIDGNIVNTEDIDSFAFNAGFDIGSGGEPIPTDFRIRTYGDGPSGSNWDAEGPANADPNDDYCFYSTNVTVSEDTMNPAMIADPSTDLAGDIDPMTGVRPIGANQDVIAVLNRAVDGSNMVMGPLLFEDCPINLASGINQFDLYDDTASIVYSGRWTLMGQVGQAGINTPAPAGGITRPSGPAQAMPVSYNDPTAEPPGYPATIAPRAIILAKWGSDDMDANNGVDPVPAVFPRSKWYVDNLGIDELGGAPPCADIAGDPTVVDGADLAQLLANWDPTGMSLGNPADYNGDGFVNGADLATLLANWGPCP
mgnify:CR=1 FL=1